MPVELIVVFASLILITALIIGYCEWKSYIKNVRTVHRCTGMVKQPSGSYAHRDYGPFANKDAANKFAYEFENKFGGYLVVDSVRMTRANKKEFQKVYEKVKKT